MPLNITYNNDKIYNSIKFENTDTGSYYKYITSQSLYFNAGVKYEITYRIYTEATSSYPFDLYITSSGDDGFLKTNNFGYLVDVVKTELNTFTEKSHIITPLYNTTASICLLLKYGTYYISEFKVKPYHRNNFSLGEMDLIIPSPPATRNEPVSIYPIYIGKNGKPVGNSDVILADAGQSLDYSRYTRITGSNLVILNDDNLIQGSLFVGNNLRTGVEISGFNNAMIRSVGYAGFNNAIVNNWPGFLLYSGSVLPGSGDNYRGVGLELHAGGNSGSLRYRVDDSGSFLELTGSIYAESGYFSGILSSSIGMFGGWTIDSNSFYSNTITLWSTQSKSSGSAIEFYDRQNEKTYLAISIQDREIISYIKNEFYTDAEISEQTSSQAPYIAVSESIKTAYFTLAESLNLGTGSSLIFDYATNNPGLPGNLIVTGAKDVQFNLYESGSFLINAPFIVDGINGIGTINSTWERSVAPFTASANANFIYNNKFLIIGRNNGEYNWLNQLYTASTTPLYLANNNSYGHVSSSTWKTVLSTPLGKINDIIHAGILAENTSLLGHAIKVGVYGRARSLTINSVFNEVTHSNRGVAILGDVIPTSDAWSGVFRHGKFAVGDPFNKFISGSISSSFPEVVLFVDASRKQGNYDNPSFGRVGINTYKPEYALHVSGSSGSLGIIYASDDIIAFSDIRRKTNIQQITGSIEKILELKGVSFNLVNGNEDKKTNTRPVVNGERRKIGLIAQEVEKVLPEVVYTDSKGYKSIAYANIVALLIEGIKEQNYKIEKLTKEIEELKKKIA